MRRRFLRILIVAAALSLVVLGSGLTVGLSWWIDFRHMNDWGWHEAASPQERLETAHRFLAFPIGAPHHDAALVVAEYRDVRSVPYLLKALERKPPTDAANPVMMCTWVHVLDALRIITGHDEGPNYPAWAKWWSEKGSKLPPGAFPLGDWKPPPLSQEDESSQEESATK